MKKLTIFALAIAFSFTAFGQSKTVADFEKSRRWIQAFPLSKSPSGNE